MSGPMGRLDARDGRTAALARTWWLLVVRGLVACVFGVFALVNPVVSLAALILVFGIYAIVDGVFTIVTGVRAAAHHGRWVLLLIEGLCGIGIGVAALVVPGVSLTVAITFLAAWAIVTGVLLLGTALRLHGGRGGWLAALGGVLSVLWGLLLFDNPFGGAVILTIWLGAYALIFGVSMIAFGMRLRRTHA